ncbi:PAS domain-containing protein [Glaciecola petra]|uniref:PAS domain-containing protein n=1 Tax=Glaciecola petra TaxID=3075602 RepID=A0ABU2ZQZ0_9ALTE|nr:PAS domain-containing protein [Aestuariibacter sp. P117]MDT0595053.1 PAS domain-containing protein [Aestuariibacter sp. P117]
MKNLSLDSMVLATYVGLGVICFLLIWLFVQALVNKRQKMRDKGRVTSNEELIQALPVGLLHLNLDGKVVYLNNLAAHLLGRDREHLTHSDFAACFKSEDQAALRLALNLAQDAPDLANLQLLARSSNLFLHIGVGDIHADRKDPFRVITLTNQNKLQKNFLQVSKELQFQNQVIDGLDYAVCLLNLKEESFMHDQNFAALTTFKEVGVEKNSAKFAPGQVSLIDFYKSIHPNDLGNWKSALEICKREGRAELECRYQLQNAQTQDGEERSSSIYLPLKCIFVSEHLQSLKDSKNNPSAAKIAIDETEILSVLIYETSQAEKQLEQLNLSQLQQQAWLAASIDPVYALDIKGNILWSNGPFNQLIRRILPKAKGRNLLALDLFPEDIKALHKNVPNISNRTYNIEFEMHTPDDKLLWIKLSLSFYHVSNRLNEKNEVGMVGVLQDISELTATKRALKQEQDQRANVLSMAPVAIATIDADDKIISANPTMLERLNLTEKDLQKRTFYQLFSDPAEAGKAAKLIHQSGKLRDFDAQLKGKDNKLNPSALHVDLLDKDKQEYLCWISDKSDEQFQQDKFESLLKHSTMPMAILGENGFTQLNKEACKFFCVEDEYDLFGISPFSERLNPNLESSKTLEQLLDNVKISSKAKSLEWEHKVGDQILPCHATYVPMYKGQHFDSILCIWMDKREMLKADEARQLAINLHQAAEREIKEKQKLLANSQDQLATKMRTLADTETRLQSVQEDLIETQSEYTHLKQEHKNVTHNLHQLKEQYSNSRTMLANAQKVNADLNTQLENSTQEMQGLNAQRDKIAHALAQSESNYKQAQKDLLESKENAEQLKNQQAEQEQKMSALFNQIDDMKEAVENKDKQINQVSNQINNLQSQLSSSASTTEQLREQLINQRKASEAAEQQRRELEHTCQLAQTELKTKARHLNHLQSEMEKLEEMSHQEKGDMEAQQSQLKQELESKLSQLHETQKALEVAQQSAEKEKQEKDSQQALLQQVQNELADMEERARVKQEQMEEKEKERRLSQKKLQHKLWQELKDKQAKLQETEQILSQAKQQTESEKAEKEKHRQLMVKLKNELQDIETRNEEQKAKMEESDERWNRSKIELKDEVEAKREQLEQTRNALFEIQRQADKERLARIEQEQKLAQLTVELSDVETRANKQKEMLAGSDEQWRKHHAEIEQQKQELQKALLNAEQQNHNLQNQLATKLTDLQAAESKVDKTQSGEKELTNELEKARNHAEELSSKISQQEQKEKQLQNQLNEHQQVLESKESSISALESKQKALTEQLASVQREYANSKESLNVQQDSHSTLSSQMSQLENALQSSKQALVEKEKALQAAQAQLKNSQNKLSEQEDALLTAHKQELENATQEKAEDSTIRPDIEKLPMPNKPADWFDLLPYLQNHPNMESLPKSLSALMTELEEGINTTEDALQHNDIKAVLDCSKKLIKISEEVNSEALGYLMKNIQNDCANGMVDNVSIRWPVTKQGFQKTLRVVYSHLHA